MYEVKISKKVQKNLDKLPQNVLQRFNALTVGLMKSGPVQSQWSNYSKLSDTEYHCHLTYHYVACWRCQNGTITIEVYYVGSRENAPY